MTATKYVPAKITKSVTDGSGRFTALLAAFGPPADHQGEYFEGPGTFAESILTWHRRGVCVPVYFNHSYDAPNSQIGELVAMHEVAEGLLVEGQLSLRNKRALEVYEALLDGSLRNLSIGFNYVGTREADDGVVITKADVIEATFTPIPAEPRAVLLTVKNRANARAAKSAYVDHVLDIMGHEFNRSGWKGRAGVFVDMRRRLIAMRDDPDCDVDDMRESAIALVESKRALVRYAEEDRADSSRRLRDRAAKAALDDLEADLSVGEKAQRHQSPDESDLVGMRRHLTTKHPNQITSVAAVEMMSLESAVAAHRIMHSLNNPTGKADEALTKSVDQLIEDVRWQAAKDRADRATFEAANAAIQLSGRAPGFSPVAERERELELQRRDLERIEQRAAEREAERASAEESARIAREDRNWHGDAYWTNDSALPQPETARERVTPRIDDQTVPDVGTTFSTPVYGVEGSEYRVTPPAAVPEARTDTGDTYKVPLASVDTPDTIVPFEETSFRIQVNQPEDSMVLEVERPIPEVPEIGETFRLNTAGEHTEIPKDGDRV